MRTTIARGARLPIAVPLLALFLSGCFGGLLGGGKPSQMYRFGDASAPAADGPAPVVARTVQLAPVTFADEIDTDRLLASRGAETFYIKGARWVSTASELFTAALRDTMRRDAPSIALLDHDAGGDAPTLQVAITRFEARYDAAAGDAAPTVRIEGVATLANGRGAAAPRRYALASTQPAASGRIDDVVAAFDAADARVVQAITRWTALSSADTRRDER